MAITSEKLLKLARFQTGLQRAKDYTDAEVKKVDDKVAQKVGSVTAGDASVKMAGTATAPTVAVALDPAADNALKLGENGLKVEIGAAPEYTIVKAAESGDYAAVYNLTKDGVAVGASINIPKDMVVKSGSVDADGNIVLVLNDEANTEIVIEASKLIEYVTSGSAAGDMVFVTVSDDHKVTATITDGTITEAKLTTELQTKINKAHDHANKDVLDGITADDVQNWDDKADKATTLSGYGIGDAYTKTEADAKTKELIDANVTLNYATDEEITAVCDAVFGPAA